MDEIPDTSKNTPQSRMCKKHRHEHPDFPEKKKKKETKSKFAPLFRYFATGTQIGRGNSYDFVCLVCLLRSNLWLLYSNNIELTRNENETLKVFFSSETILKTILLISAYL